MADWLNSLLGGAGSAVSGIINSVGSIYANQQNKQLAREQMSWNEEQTEKQNQWNLEQWNRQNEYNSYANDLQRWKDAGLNPLMYGGDGGNASSLTSATPLGYDRASVENPTVGLAKGVGESALIASEIKSREYDNELKKQQAEKTRVETIRQQLETSQSIEMFGLKVEAQGLDNQLTAQQIRNTEKEFEVMDTNLHNSIEKLKLDSRAQKLNEMSFEFSKWLNESKLDQTDRQIAIQMYNYEVNKLLADSTLELNGQHLKGLKLDNDGKAVEVRIAEATEANTIKTTKVRNWTGVGKDVAGAVATIAGSVYGAGKLAQGAKVATEAAARAKVAPSPIKHYDRFDTKSLSGM